MISLYHTSGCHLCELAQAELRLLGLDATLIDISDSAELVEELGWLIPVLRHSSGAQLNWPFDAQQIEQWLSCQSQPQ